MQTPQKFNMIVAKKRVFGLKKNRRYVMLGTVCYYSPVKSTVPLSSEVLIQYRLHPQTSETMSVTLCLSNGSKERWWALDNIAEMKANMGRVLVKDAMANVLERSRKDDAA